ncbi:MAG: DPP IV N-terminal domain-containing protein, partial [Anaerolineae bacterium]|nr:DPP IV N-terminal domain-containing protein [Anaerolineae bacterium]
RVTRLTQTPAGDETAPVLEGGWLAFATRVADRYQSVTCVPLAELHRQDVYAFGQPVEEVGLSWRTMAGEELLLSVIAAAAGETSELTVDPASRRVGPAEADLQYLPVVRGEQAWLPNLVSRVRELPFVGPEKIAFLENVFFTVVDWVTRLQHGLGTAATAPATATPSPAPVQPTASPTAGPEATVTTEPTLEPTPGATATPTLTPTPEGTVLADGIVWRGSVKPDPQRPYADVEIIDIDPSLLQVKMICGTIEPKPSTGLVGTGVIPREDWPSLVAGFNGGFAAMHGQYGMMVDRKVYLPARDGVATLAVYEDGSIRMGTWGRDLVQTPDMVSYRQNCPPLIENGQITAETGKLTLWGLSISNQVYLYRSGLGLTRDGRLVYVAGKPLSAYTLARALQMAGAVYAMQLDVDEWHVCFITYDVQQGEGEAGPVVTGHKLRSDMHGFDGYFLRPFQLDFFYLTRRPEPLAQAVRMVATPQAPSAVPTLVAKDLPGRIAFASDRDGNWELYTVRPGQPESLARITEHPADDLYPAWSRDGKALAFASRRDGNSEVYVMDMATGDVRRVTHHEAEEWAPCWSPDGQTLAYQSDRNGQSDIYVCALDGSGETRLTPMEGNHEAPDWSPDGRRFVFDSDLDVSQPVHASINLYFMGADGSNPHRFLSGAESPRWSPDGRRVAFTTRRTGHWQVFLVNADGSGLRQLTRGAYDARYPSWSPDGRWIAYAGNEDGHWELYVIAAEGGEPQRLTAGTSDSTYPAWGP